MCTVQTTLFKLLKCSDEEFEKLLRIEDVDNFIHVKADNINYKNLSNKEENEYE